MLRHCVNGLIIAACVSFSANSASAVPLDKNATVDSGGHRTQREHVNYCQDTRYRCLQELGLTPRSPSAATYCRISYDQCMNRWKSGPVQSPNRRPAIPSALTFRGFR